MFYRVFNLEHFLKFIFYYFSLEFYFFPQIDSLLSKHVYEKKKKPIPLKTVSPAALEKSLAVPQTIKHRVTL